MVINEFEEKNRKITKNIGFLGEIHETNYFERIFGNFFWYLEQSKNSVDGLAQ